MIVVSSSSSSVAALVRLRLRRSVCSSEPISASCADSELRRLLLLS